MQYPSLRTAFVIAFVAALCGCQTWHSQSGLSGLGFSRDERQIVQQAQHDPFPTPTQVGMK
jgi:hypothetical protein